MFVQKSKDFANGSVYAISLHDGYLVETTDTFLPYYTKDAIGNKQNLLRNDDLGDRTDCWNCHGTNDWDNKLISPSIKGLKVD